MDRDTRGWIMTALSGIACMFGAGLICIDIFVRRLPGKQNFRIQDSNGFLSSSLSLSFGVMLFSALYKMLPSAKAYLQSGGLSNQAAAWALILLFLAGAIGIQVVSRIMHHYIPSQVVDCDHTHDEDEEAAAAAAAAAEMNSCPDTDDEESLRHGVKQKTLGLRQDDHKPKSSGPASGHDLDHHVSIHDEQTNKSQMKPWKMMLSTSKVCDDNGRCYGYTEPCGQDCFKRVQSRYFDSVLHRPSLPRRATTTAAALYSERSPLLFNHNSDVIAASTSSSSSSNSTAKPQSNGHPEPFKHSQTQKSMAHSEHHHHVPTNAFLSIGLQTSLAIALHKLPEGFITYATNHANPKLGTSVFLSLFIHNITEGFALALPLYLALRSRPKAILWSTLLGGISQPLGAGVAALWFKIAGNGDWMPGEGVYGGMFAIIAGIMASVALQLFSESLDLTHDRGLCMTFAFVGMGIMGATSAMTVS